MSDAITQPDDLIALIAAGLSGRLRSLAAVLDRLDRLESGSGAWLATFAGAELPDAAAELALRALRTTADPTNFAILKALAAGESHQLGRLMETTNLGRLALTERLNDLVQVGLATRLIDTDHAQITPAGASMARLLDMIIAEAVKQYPGRPGR